MKIKVGIPRALFYYYYFPAWETFFKELGAEVVLSSPTHKGIVNHGVTAAVDEACLPVKVFYGHVIELIPKVDMIFLPRLVSVEKKTYICPKFMGLPDMIKANLSPLPPIIDICVDISRNDKQYRRELYSSARLFTKDNRVIRRAEKAALKRLEDYRRLMEQGWIPEEAIALMARDEKEDSALEAERESAVGRGEVNGELCSIKETTLNIALLGHGYTIYDEYLSHRVINKLRRMGARVMTPELLPRELVEEEARRLPKRMFWTMGKGIIGSAFHFMDSEECDGIIHLACFGCGPDSLVAELVEIMAHRRREPPFMMLTIDEHTGEAGIITRLEAFIDLVKRRRQTRAGDGAGNEERIKSIP